jgi:MscS family membrane protein
MKRLFLLLTFALGLLAAMPLGFAADAAADATPATDNNSPNAAEHARNTTEAAAINSGAAKTDPAHPPDFLEHLVDSILEAFDVRSTGNTLTHYVIAMCFLIGAILLRRVVTGIIFNQLKKFAAKTETTLDDKLFPALEAPVATFVMVTGIFAALKVLKLSAESDNYITIGSKVAFALVIFWGLFRAFTAVLEHAHEVAREKQMGIAPFMPWIRKTLISVFCVVGALIVVQSLGYGENLKTVLAGLGIGSLAFALAAQDTIANLFGSIVVAIDQPFKIGEAVKIGANVGTVEDIGLRSTRIRLVDKSLMTIPNKTTAAETITNLSRFTRRRFEQVIGLTYDATPAQLEAIVEEIRGLITAQPEVDKNGIMVFFRDFNASSLDLWVVYECPDPDFQKAMRTKQRINLAIMRAVEVRGLSFAFPTQTVHLAGEIAERLTTTKKTPES